MTHRNLRLYNLTYYKAEELLGRKKRDQLWIANNTLLYKDHDRYEPSYRVKLHSTTILTLYRDGSVRIGHGGWNNSYITKGRFRDLLPSHMHITWGSPGKGIPDMICIGVGDGKTVVRPLGDFRTFKSDGTSDALGPMNQRDAFDTWNKVRAYSKKFVQAFLYGKISSPKPDDFLKAQNSHTADFGWMRYALELLDTRELSPTVLSPVINASNLVSLGRWMFYKEAYKCTSPVRMSSMNEAELLNWMERKLKKEQDFRPLPGTVEHQNIRSTIKADVENYFALALLYR